MCCLFVGYNIHSRLCFWFCIKNKLKLCVFFKKSGNVKKIIIASTVCCLFILLSHASTLASGSGHHAHGDDEVRSSDRNTSVTYKDTQDGIEAFLEFSDFEKVNQDSSHNFFMKCSIRVFLKDPKSGKYLQPSKIACNGRSWSVWQSCGVCSWQRQSYENRAVCKRKRRTTLSSDCRGWGCRCERISFPPYLLDN